MGFPHTHRATNPSPLVVTPRCHLEVEKREVSLKRRGIPKKEEVASPGKLWSLPCRAPTASTGGKRAPQKPPRVSFVPHSHGLPVFWDYRDSCRALPLPTGLAGIPEILLPSGKRKKKLIASSTRSSPTAPWGWRNRRGAELVGLSPWSWPQAGSVCGGCGGCFWGAGRGHAAADGDPTRGLGGRKVSGAGQDEVLGVRCAPPVRFTCSGSFFSHLIAG